MFLVSVIVWRVFSFPALLRLHSSQITSCAQSYEDPLRSFLLLLSSRRQYVSSLRSCYRYSTIVVFGWNFRLRMHSFSCPSTLFNPLEMETAIIQSTWGRPRAALLPGACRCWWRCQRWNDDDVHDGFASLLLRLSLTSSSVYGQLTVTKYVNTFCWFLDARWLPATDKDVKRDEFVHERLVAIYHIALWSCKSR